MPELQPGSALAESVAAQSRSAKRRCESPQVAAGRQPIQYVFHFLSMTSVAIIFGYVLQLIQIVRKLWFARWF
jgi:hypothetical protein